MLIEGIAYGFFLILIINGTVIFDLPLFYVYEKYFFNFYSSIGAGVWEEIFFRLLI